MATRARSYVWDVPTRLFHWLLVALIGFSWWSAEERRMDWHVWSGLLVCGLLAFRILWGLFGTSTARFGQFLKGPRAVWRYVRPEAGDPQPAPLGHNPLGGWSVVAMLLVLLVQVGSGLFAVDVDGIDSGTLSYLVDFDTGRTASDIHDISFTALQALVVLHVLAILFYAVVKRRDLIGPMVTGSTRHGSDAEAVRRVPIWRLIPVIAVAWLVLWVLSVGGRF